MAYVRRANVVLEIKDDQIDRFVDQGYDIIDESGKIVSKSTPKDVGSLLVALKKEQEKVARLEATIEQLNKSTSKPKPVTEEKEEVEEEVIKPKSTKTKAKSR